MQSVWNANAKRRGFEKLEGDARTDVLVIGGGMAGLLCAYALSENNVDCVLVEGGRIGGGMTGNTTAKITVQHGAIYSRLIKKYGFDFARNYYLANKRALDTYRSMCRTVDCDFEDTDAYLFTTGDTRVIELEAEACNSLGCKTEIVSALNIPIGRAAAVVKEQAQFDPMKFISAISSDLNIYENTFVNKVEGNTAYTPCGKISARKIVFCTHFPFINRRGLYPLKLYQSTSYVIALENATDVNGIYIDERENGLSFRNYNGLLLIGGGGHRTGKLGGGYAELEAFADNHFPGAEIKYRWSAQDCMSLDGVPYIGHYSSTCPDWYVATGFNKWGMTSSMVAAQNITDLILRRKNPYVETFSPSRSILTKQLFINAGSAAANLMNFGKKRCPHMGCALKWNAAEHTWDCPCHGSRFDESGKLINNPAMRDIDTK